MSLIHTAELNGVAPFEYLVAVLRNHAPAAVTPAAWMPWNYRSAAPAQHHPELPPDRQARSPRLLRFE